MPQEILSDSDSSTVVALPTLNLLTAHIYKLLLCYSSYFNHIEILQSIIGKYFLLLF